MRAFAACAAALALAGAAPAPATAPIVMPQTTGERWSASDVAKLHFDIDSLLASSSAVRGAHVGVLALDTRTGAMLYERDADDEFQPASTLKLLVGSVALEKLGAAYRFKTSLERVGDALVLRAGGDPLLAASDLDDAARSVVAAGVSHASGLSVDASRYDTPPYPAGWVWDDFGYDYAARVSAAALDRNVASYSVAPGSNAGEPALVSRDGAAVVPDAACPGLVDRALTGVAGSAASLDTETLAPDCVAITGTLPLGTTSSVAVTIRDPAAHLADELRVRLTSPGSAFTIGADAGANAVVTSAASPLPATGAGQTIWQHASPPLGSWLGARFWIPSDNFVAELLLCEVGYVVNGAPGSTAAGKRAELDWLRANGIDPATVTLADGSGLSQYDRITPRTLVAILQHDWNGPNRGVVLDSLPIGGARGSIEGIAGTAAAGRVFAKTGSMSHVRGLAGYVATLRHGAVTFAFNVDDWNGDYAPLAALRARVITRIVTD